MSRPILCICVCVTIDAVLNFDRDVYVYTNEDLKCEQSINLGAKELKTLFQQGKLAIVTFLSQNIQLNVPDDNGLDLLRGKL